MVTIKVSYEDVIREFPEDAEKFLRILRGSGSPYKNTPPEQIEWYYTLGSFLSKSTKERYQEVDKYTMLYPDRLEFELEKTRVHLNMKAKYFTYADRVDGLSPIVRNVLSEYLKVMMTVEQKNFDHPEVIVSIPPLKEASTEEAPGPPQPEAEHEEPSLEEQLRRAIELENYEEAVRIRDLITRGQ